MRCRWVISGDLSSAEFVQFGSTSGSTNPAKADNRTLTLRSDAPLGEASGGTLAPSHVVNEDNHVPRVDPAEPHSILLSACPPPL